MKSRRNILFLLGDSGSIHLIIVMLNCGFWQVRRVNEVNPARLGESCVELCEQRLKVGADPTATPFNANKIGRAANNPRLFQHLNLNKLVLFEICNIRDPETPQSH